MYTGQPTLCSGTLTQLQVSATFVQICTRYSRAKDLGTRRSYRYRMRSVSHKLLCVPLDLSIRAFNSHLRTCLARFSTDDGDQWPALDLLAVS